MHETFISDSEDEGGEDSIAADNFNYNYLLDDIKNLTDEQNEQFDVELHQNYVNTDFDELNPLRIHAVDNIEIPRNPINVGFLVSFLVDARGGAMRGCRHSGVHVIVPPKSAQQPTRITCRYVKPQRTPNPPPLMEGEALVSRILELGPIGAKFLGPVILEVPHFASLRNKEREIVILRSDNGETWREHALYDCHDEIQSSLIGDDPNDDFQKSRLTRIVTNDFPHFFAVLSRIRQEVHAIGSEGGTVSSTAVPQVQAVFPANALTKRIKVGLQAQPIDPNITAKYLGRGVAVSPVVTVEPRRRKFHKAITLSMTAPKAQTQGMINQYSGSAPTLRLLCSITGGQNRAVWEDVTGSTPLTFVKDCVSFTTTVSARFWLMDCRNISEAAKMATDLYKYMAHVPFMVKFVVFAKRVENNEAKLSVFCMTDDKEDKTLEQQENFTEIAKSRDVEVLEGRTIYLELAGNLIPVLKSGEQLSMEFNAFKENRLVFTVHVKDLEDASGRICFMNEPRVAKGEEAQTPICNIVVSLPEKILEDYDNRSLEDDENYSVLFDRNLYSTKIDSNIHKADIRLSDICNLLGNDWMNLAKELEISQNEVELIEKEYPEKSSQQAMVMLRLWLRQSGKQATGNTLEQALHRIKRSDIVDKCIFNLELVTDEMEKAVAKIQLDQSGFDNLKEELGPSRDTSLRRNQVIDQNYCIEKIDKLANDVYKNDGEFEGWFFI